MLHSFHKKIPKILTNQKNAIVALVVIFVVRAFGVHLIQTSHAQSPYVSAEAENGTLAGGATIQTDPNASGGQYVQFGSPSSTWSCTGNVPVDDSSNWTYTDNNTCTFPEDSTDFVGMNNPNMMFGLGYQINQDVWSPFCITSTGASVGPNDSTCVTRETQELQANSAQDYVITSNTPTNTNGNVTAYPDVGTYAYTGVLDDYTSLTSTYNLTMPINSNTIAWVTHDDWLSEPGTPDGSFTYEVQIHYDASITSSYYCPSTWSQGNFGVVASE